MRFKRLFVSALIFFFLHGSLFALTLDEEKKYGREVYSEVSRSANLLSDPYVCIYMNIIKSRLEAAADLPLPIKLTIIDSPTLEAFATAGGYVFITTGILEQADKEEEVAGVLAHEFGHVGKRHVSKAMEKEKYLTWATLATVLLAALGPADAAAKGALLAGGMGAGEAVALKFSRENEEEADRAGVGTAERAGYNGRGSAEFLKKIASLSNEKDYPPYLLTHPYSTDRVMKIEQLASPMKTWVDDSFFPFLLVRLSVLGKPLSAQNEEIWLNRYRKDPKNAANCYGAALIYSMKGDTGRGLDLLGRLDSPYRPLLVGELLVRASRFKEAVDVLNPETHPVARYFLAKAYEGQGNLQMAGRVYKELIPFAGTFPEAYQRIGMTLGKQGDQAGGYAFLGRYYLETGRDGAARTNLEKAITKYGINAPESAELLMLLDTIKGSGKKNNDTKGNGYGRPSFLTASPSPFPSFLQR
jgi:predicted Zn-dependent protease